MPANPLCRGRSRRRNAFTTSEVTSPEATRGQGEGPGNRLVVREIPRPVVRPGSAPAAGATGCAESCGARPARPLHLIHAGASFFLPALLPGERARSGARACELPWFPCHNVSAWTPLRWTTRPPSTRPGLLDEQGRACRILGSELYARPARPGRGRPAPRRPVADVLDGYLAEPRSSVIALRLLGAAHALALTGQAAQLAAVLSVRGRHRQPGTGRRRRLGRAAADAGRPPLDRPGLAAPPAADQRGRPGRGAARRPAAHRRRGRRCPSGWSRSAPAPGSTCAPITSTSRASSGSYGPAASPVVLADGWLGDPPAGGADRDRRPGRRRPRPDRPDDARGQPDPHRLRLARPARPAGAPARRAHAGPLGPRRRCDGSRPPPPWPAPSWPTAPGPCSGTRSSASTWTRRSAPSWPPASRPWPPRRPRPPGSPTCTWSSRGRAAARSP